MKTKQIIDFLAARLSSIQAMDNKIGLVAAEATSTAVAIQNLKKEDEKDCAENELRMALYETDIIAWDWKRSIQNIDECIKVLLILEKSRSKHYNLADSSTYTFLLKQFRDKNSSLVDAVYHHSEVIRNLSE